VYEDNFYGTHKSEIDKKLAEGKNVVFDVERIGGINIKNYYKERVIGIFIMPPSVEVLYQLLEKRGTDSPKVIDNRLAKATYEMSFAPQFDVTIKNDDFYRAKREAVEVIKVFVEWEQMEK
jgi:guanylate kinase